MESAIIEVSKKAQTQMLNILKGQDNDNEGIRVGVIGGGCSGLSYNIDFGQHKENDRIIDLDGLKIFIDPKSSIYLDGVIIDFSDGLQGKGFTFKNPNASNTCGCGESFSV